MKRESSSTRWGYETRRATLCKLRRQLGISQRALSKASGVAYASICRFERKQRDLSAETLAKVENALADICADRRMVETFYSQRFQAALWSKRIREARERSSESSDEANLFEQVVTLKIMVKTLQQQNLVLEELHTLQDEIIRQLEAAVPCVPKEVPALVKRVQMLATKK